MYRSTDAALLFVLSDGGEGTAIADRETPFPGIGWSGIDGQDGWYSVIGLIEYLNNKKQLLTRKLMDEFMRGQRDYFTWEAGLANDWLARVVGLFAPGTAQTWQSDFAQYARTRRYG